MPFIPDSRFTKTSLSTYTLQRASPSPQTPPPSARLLVNIYKQGTAEKLVTFSQNVSLEGQNKWEELSIGLTVKEAVDIEVICENTSTTPVFFDDISVKVQSVPTTILVQENHYYPFGLGMRGLDWTLTPNRENKYQYNGGVEKNTDFDLNWYETLYRDYDLQTSRFLQVDPRSEDGNQENLTPYHYSYNNPIRYNDPKGDCPNGDCWEMIKSGAKAVVETTVEFANGFANAVASNNTNVVDMNGNVVLSGVQRQQPMSFAHQAGQQAGDLASVAQGALEIAGGALVGTGGVTITVGSVGTLTIAGAGAAVAGAGIMVHGGNTAKNALNNITNESGRVYAHGKKNQSTGSFSGAKKTKHQKGEKRDRMVTLDKKRQDDNWVQNPNKKKEK